MHRSLGEIKMVALGLLQRRRPVLAQMIPTRRLCWQAGIGSAGPLRRARDLYLVDATNLEEGGMRDCDILPASDRRG